MKEKSPKRLKHKKDPIERLCITYRTSNQIGLILGAGVTYESGVPLYQDIVYELFNSAHSKGKLRKAPQRAVKFLQHQSDLRKNSDKKFVFTEPDVIAQFLRKYIDSKETFLKLIRDVLYKNIEKRSHKMVSSKTYGENKTLDAIISFCAAVPGSRLAPESKNRWAINSKVGGILTTNYDNLVEGSFGSKFKISLLKPVAREGSKEAILGKRVIPVYHMHGYVSYIYDKNKPVWTKASEVVIAEDDYYRTFYNLLGFSNVVAMSFLRRFPCLFIGCSMTDRNIRRILYHLKKERISSSEVHKHYAILPIKRNEEDEFNDSLLEAFGVTSIRIDSSQGFGNQIELILKQLYLSVDGIDEHNWNLVKKGGIREKRMVF